MSSPELPPSLVQRLHAVWGDEAWQRYEDDPFGTLLALPGIDFVTADRLALAAGGDPAHPQRLERGLLYVLSQAARSAGHSCLPREELITSTARLLFRGIDLTGLGDPVWLCEQALERLLDLGEVAGDTGLIYLASLYEAEVETAEHLERLLSWQAPNPISLEQVAAILERCPYGPLDDDQIRAVQAGLNEPVSILTGGPGTGKTTTIAALGWCARHLAPAVEIVLAASTGRAARRLAEMTGDPAVTIHRLLEMVPGPDGDSAAYFRRDEDNPISGDLLIVDEASMLDLPLAASLFRAVPGGMRVVLVGDAAQLPPIGPGDVLRDLMAAGVPAIRLERIFRQQDAPAIVQVARQVHEGVLPQPDPDNGFTWHICSHDAQAVDLVVDAAVEAVEAGVPLAEVQVLSPFNRGAAGVDALNKALQERLNPPGPGEASLQRGSIKFRLGDKVMCIRNNYSKGPDGIFNGQVGIVRQVDPEARRLFVDFDGWLTEYEGDELDELRLAYCMTIHKSQGSEFDTVVLCLARDHWPMLRRNLIYTAVTRARRRLVLVASRQAVQRAVAQGTVQRRHSGLVERIAAAVESRY